MDNRAIKNRIKVNAPKGVIMAKGDKPTGRTNSANPANIDKLTKAYHAIEAAQVLPVSKIAPVPTKNMPTIKDHYKEQGEALGICPYELRDILIHVFTEEDALAFGLLKKFVMAAKLSGAVDFSATHESLRHAEDVYQSNLRRREESIKNNLKTAAVKETAIKLAEADFAQAWGNILIELVQKINNNNDVKSLGTWDRWMIEAIARQGSRYAKITRGKVTIDFANCRKMKPEIVSRLPQKAIDLRIAHERYERHKNLGKASLDELEALYNDYTRDGDYENAEEVYAEIRFRDSQSSEEDGNGYLGHDPWNQTSLEYQVLDFLRGLPKR